MRAKKDLKLFLLFFFLPFGRLIVPDHVMHRKGHELKGKDSKARMHDGLGLTGNACSVGAGSVVFSCFLWRWINFT